MARLLLVHGLGGTAATMAPLATELAALGHDVATLTLPGHGTEPAALTEVGWEEWLEAVTAAAALHQARVIVGQSLGAALALAMAADGGCAAVVAISTPAADPDALDGLEWRRSRGHEWVDGAPLAEGEEGYDRLPIAALVAMTKGVADTELGRVTVPVLLVAGALDDTADPAVADVVAGALAGPVQRLVLARSGHVASLGPERALLAHSVDTFVCTLGV
jgi:carboxylesterase